MPEDIKDEILKFLTLNKGHKFNVKEIAKNIRVSYPTALKWVAVLHAEGLISLEDYGNVKLVYVK